LIVETTALESAEAVVPAILIRVAVFVVAAGRQRGAASTITKLIIVAIGVVETARCL
jgi:hypothetical protein